MFIKYMQRKYLALICIVFTALLTGCNESENSTEPPTESPKTPFFSSAGLDGRIVYRIEIIDNLLHAATDKGFYREAENNNWELLGNPDWRIIDWVVVEDGHFILSTSDADPLLGLPSIFELHESLDSGLTWQKIEHNFGGVELGEATQEQIFRLAFDGTALYGTGWGAVGQSLDAGRSWELVDGFWDAAASGLKALTLSPDKNVIWYGGQGGIEDLVLRNYNLNSDISTDHSQKTVTLLPSPSVTTCIRFYHLDEQRIFACAEGGIIQTNDNGASWSPFLLNSEHRFYFDLIVDESQLGRYFTAGWTKTTEPQILTLDISQDEGESWSHYSHPNTDIYGGVYSMTSRVEGAELAIYLGLYRGGVIRVSNLP